MDQEAAATQNKINIMRNNIYKLESLYNYIFKKEYSLHDNDIIISFDLCYDFIFKNMPKYNINSINLFRLNYIYVVSLIKYKYKFFNLIFEFRILLLILYSKRRYNTKQILPNELFEYIYNEHLIV